MTLRKNWAYISHFLQNSQKEYEENADSCSPNKIMLIKKGESFLDELDTSFYIKNDLKTIFVFILFQSSIF